MSIVYRSVQIPSDLLEALGDTSELFWSDPAIEPIIHDAIRAWLKNPPSTTPQQPAIASNKAGYQWKQVFLPAGTRLRASFARKPYFAVVTGNRIRHGTQNLSPSAFANLHGSGTRNAWHTIWLRFPGNEQWLLADTCRARQNAALASLFGSGTQKPSA